MQNLSLIFVQAILREEQPLGCLLKSLNVSILASFLAIELPSKFYYSLRGELF
jgi:hypothetical protein